jgi:hypothetical protein
VVQADHITAGFKLEHEVGAQKVFRHFDEKNAKTQKTQKTQKRTTVYEPVKLSLRLEVFQHRLVAMITSCKLFDGGL